MSDKRVCCFEKGHDGAHNFAPAYQAQEIPDSCLAEDPEMSYEELKAKIAELEDDRDIVLGYKNFLMSEIEDLLHITTKP